MASSVAKVSWYWLINMWDLNSNLNDREKVAKKFSDPAVLRSLNHIRAKANEVNVGDMIT